MKNVWHITTMVDGCDELIPICEMSDNWQSYHEYKACELPFALALEELDRLEENGARGLVLCAGRCPNTRFTF